MSVHEKAFFKKIKKKGEPKKENMMIIFTLTAFVQLFGSLVSGLQTVPEVFNIGAVLSSGANIALFLQVSSFIKLDKIR